MAHDDTAPKRPLRDFLGILPPHFVGGQADDEERNAILDFLAWLERQDGERGFHLGLHPELDAEDVLRSYEEDTAI